MERSRTIGKLKKKERKKEKGEKNVDLLKSKSNKFSLFLWDTCSCVAKTNITYDHMTLIYLPLS